MIIITCKKCGEKDGCILVVSNQGDMPTSCPYDGSGDSDWKFQGDIEDATPQINNVGQRSISSNALPSG